MYFCLQVPDVSLNKSSDIFVLGEDEVNPVIQMKVRYGLKVTKIPIKMVSKYIYRIFFMAHLGGCWLYRYSFICVFAGVVE